ncbi:hypothetical protein [Streptomyces sp. NPDC014894]|uniref:hypothetical protein n=1 Tax=Streptomyces sp. NPDC014894 TaxID=3364931 RepID=UPI0036FD831B
MLRKRLARPLPVLTAVVVLAIAVLVLGQRLWNGEPYPAADPDRTAARLKQEAQRAHDEMALPASAEAITNGVETTACSYRGLRSVTRVDGSLGGVRGFRLAWRVTDVPRDTALAGQKRVRERLVREGWRLRDENVSGTGFRFERSAAGHRIDVAWYEPTGTLAVTAHAPCGKLPDGFDDHAWPESAWSPVGEARGAPASAS